MMRRFQYAGVAVYVTTPIKASGEIDYDEFKRHVEYVISGGCDIVIPGGAAGQHISLSWEENRKLIEIVVEKFGDRVFCIAYTSHPYTDEAIKRTREAKAIGAHAVNLLAPWFTVPTPTEIYLHFKKVAEAVDIPITLFNNEPIFASNSEVYVRRANSPIPWAVTVRLAREHSNIVGIMEENLLNAYYILAELRHSRSDFTVLNGLSEVFLPHFVALGAAGTESWMENVVPGKITVPVLHALKGGEIQKARDILFKHRDLIDLFIASDAVPINLHFMLNSMGWKMGIPRAPYAYPPGAPNQQRYVSVLKKHGLLEAVT